MCVEQYALWVASTCFFSVEGHSMHTAINYWLWLSALKNSSGACGLIHPVTSARRVQSHHKDFDIPVRHRSLRKLLLHFCIDLYEKVLFFPLTTMEGTKLTNPKVQYSQGSSNVSAPLPSTIAVPQHPWVCFMLKLPVALRHWWVIAPPSAKWDLLIPETGMLHVLFCRRMSWWNKL